MTQAEQNPFVNSDTNKRYYTYDYYLRKTFGGKCAKLPLSLISRRLQTRRLSR